MFIQENLCKMENIVENLQQTIKKIEHSFENNSKLKEFEKASIQFEELVKKGLVQRRGYNLMSITDMHLHRLEFNITNNNINNQKVNIVTKLTALK